MCPDHISHTNVEVIVNTFNHCIGADLPGRTIDLFAILSQHQRSEKLSKKRLQPAIRVTGDASIDTEAAELCDALDGAVALPMLEQCSRVSSWRRNVEW